MLLLDTKKEFERFAIANRVQLGDLTSFQSIELMIKFFSEVMADDAATGDHDDMLLFQWGTYNWGQGESFEFNITRQLCTMDAIDDDGMWQLSLTLKYTPTLELKSIGSDNLWYRRSEKLDEFKAYIANSAASVVIENMLPNLVELDFEECG